MRTALVTRATNETKIEVSITLDGDGTAGVATGIGFFDHMLTLLARHGMLTLTVRAEGDLQVDAHHTVEDVGIALGQALKEALGDKRGITRYGSCLLPMDETLALAALDISGRPFLVFEGGLPEGRLGDFEIETTEEFFRAFAFAAGLTLHLKVLYGRNTHHKIEALFKACGRALRQAAAADPLESGIPSTKGVL